MLTRTALAAIRRVATLQRAPVGSSVRVGRAAIPTALFSSEAQVVPGIGKGKTSTGIVGLPVDPDAVDKIVEKYQAILDKMAASDMPETAQYRMDVEKVARYRIKVAMEHPDDPEMIEDLCMCGQVEELVQQADEEMQVLDMYLETRMWELVATDDEDIDIEYDPDPSKDHEGLDDEEK